jgi:steroid delta-isomerase-like uncharacterized protein
MHETVMRELVDRHLRAEGKGDIDGALAVYTDDIEHEVIGFPDGRNLGLDAARGFYDHLTANFRAEHWTVLHQYVARDALVLDQFMTGTVVGSMFGLVGNGRRIAFRMLHVFEFRDDLISRENIWLDMAAVIDQLS